MLNKCFVFIQARTNSSRLPGKVLKTLTSSDGKKILDLLLQRVYQVFPWKYVVLLIPDDDSELQTYCQKNSVQYFIGDEQDVRQRYILAAQKYGADFIIRLTGDNPFIDIEYLELLLEAIEDDSISVFSFSNLPLGAAGEAFSYRALITEPEEGLLAHHREHVSLHMKEGDKKYIFRKLKPVIHFEHSEKIRITIDEPKDLQFAGKLYQKFKETNPFFGILQLEKLYQQQPELFHENCQVKQISFSTKITKNTQQKKIFILYGNTDEYGSGHYERMKILYVKIQVWGYNVEIGHTLPKEIDEYYALIIDHRDLVIPSEWRHLKILLLDNLGTDRQKYPYMDTLPNLENQQKEISFLATSILNYHKQCINKNIVLIYSGDLSSEKVEQLDRWIVQTFPDETSIIRIGSAESKLKQIQIYPRLSKKQYIKYIAQSKYYITYFGQGLWEALYLQKRVFTYSIGEYHQKLSEKMQEEYSIPYIGDINHRLSTLTSQSKKNVQKIDNIKFNDGYKRIIEYIKENF